MIYIKFYVVFFSYYFEYRIREDFYNVLDVFL